VLENSITLARFAAISQSHGLVPIVEPEVLMDGDFPPEVAGRVTERILSAVVKALADHHVFLEGLILKPNMVRSGSDNAHQADPEEIGWRTLRAIQRTVPVALPAVTFLSGGLSEEIASLALCAVNNAPGAKPWYEMPPKLSSPPTRTLSFSFGRALQQSCLHAWLGKDENIASAQSALLERAKANSLASQGQYTGGAGGNFALQSNFVRNYIY
jgi:fructose-bisphosphate aldolase, class I